MTSPTLDATQIRSAAETLDAAERSRQPTRQLSQVFPGLTIPDAYAIQTEWVRQKVAQGRTVRGHKIGLTSRAMQLVAGIDEPDYGVLLDDMFYESGDRLPSDRFIVPRVEVELGFVLKKPLRGPGVTLFDVYDAVAYVVPAMEVVDSRQQLVDPQTQSRRKVVDTISDNAANAAVVIGGRPMGIGEIDLRWVGAILSRNGAIEETGVGAGVLNHPANGIVWLANRLGAYGVGLEAGQFVMSGSFTRVVDARPNDVFHADFGAMGSIACQFT